MACTAGITGVTPGKGTSIATPRPEFVERCVNCDGTFPSIKFDPDKKEQRMSCSVCKRKTKHFCWKCRRYLCNEPPKNQTGRDGKRFPNMFSVKVPKLRADQRLQRDDEGKVIFQTEYGVLTCYLIAHQEQWKKMYENKQKQVAVAVSAGSSKSSAPGRKRGKSS